MNIELEQLSRTVRQLIAKTLGTSESDLGPNPGMGITETWDSFAHLNLILLLEESFNLVIPDDEVTTLISQKAIENWLGNQKC